MKTTPIILISLALATALTASAEVPTMHDVAKKAERPAGAPEWGIGQMPVGGGLIGLAAMKVL